MSYDDPPELSDDEVAAQETAQAAARNKQIAITGLTVDDVHATVRSVVESNYRIHERIDEAIDEAIAKKVAEITEATIRERVAQEVERVIVEGFSEYDKWNGRPSGKIHTITELIHKLVTEVREDGYNNKGTLAERTIRKAVTELFEKELKGLVEQLKADFKKQADAVFKAKLVAGMKEAIGLRD